METINLTVFKADALAKLSTRDLIEGKVYSLPFLSLNDTVIVRGCLFRKHQGTLWIHRSANWEDVPEEDHSLEAFMPHEIKYLPLDFPCFKET